MRKVKWHEEPIIGKILACSACRKKMVETEESYFRCDYSSCDCNFCVSCAEALSGALNQNSLAIMIDYISQKAGPPHMISDKDKVDIYRVARLQVIKASYAFIKTLPPKVS